MKIFEISIFGSYMCDFKPLVYVLSAGVLIDLPPKETSVKRWTISTNSH